jgi:hypothetical protein
MVPQHYLLSYDGWNFLPWFSKQKIARHSSLGQTHTLPVLLKPMMAVQLIRDRYFWARKTKSPCSPDLSTWTGVVDPLGSRSGDHSRPVPNGARNRPYMCIVFYNLLSWGPQCDWANPNCAWHNCSEYVNHANTSKVKQLCPHSTRI